jgi:hypothetical protein
MNTEIKILKPSEIKDNLVSFLRNRSLIPIVGAGISCGAPAYEGSVPSGIDYKTHMIEELSKDDDFSEDEKKSFKETTFSVLCGYYEDDDIISPQVRLEYLKANFYKVNLEDDIRSSLFDINWPYVYSLNVDDAIERASKYKKIILPNKEINEKIFIEEKCLIKLHGDINEIITYNDAEKIFTSKEYALSIERNAPLLNKLRNDYKNQNIIFIGCSLDDEIDLQTLSTLPLHNDEKDNLSRKIIFVKGKPNKLQQSKFKSYGITDIVCFDEYDQMYVFLSDIWNEIAEIPEDELDKYTRINSNYINANLIEENQNYFFWGKGLYDSKKHIINYPYFFITRTIKNSIINNLKQNKVHLVYGSRLSGKSYLIADIYKTIRDREVFYFDGRARITQIALDNLIKKKKIVVLFDIGTIRKEQFEYILQNAQQINKNQNNFIINVNNNDSDSLGIVKWKLKQNIIQSTDILTYSLSNKYNFKETENINSLYPVVNLPPYSGNRTLLDQSIYAEELVGKKGQFSSNNIRIKSSKQLAFLITLAIKEKLYSLDIINYAFDFEVVDAIKKYDPFIERIETKYYEKDNSDLSSIKYVLNSKYWLRRELGNYARNTNNHEKIGEAYEYIIERIIEFSGKNEYKQRDVCRDFIMFDMMNDIFLDRYQGNIKLIVYVYTKLHKLLARDFHFLHQKAKCYLNFSHFLKDNEVERIKYLNDALELANISKAMIEKRYADTKNERLQITLSHTQYTLATIYCETCKIHNYLDITENEKTIDAINEAIYSPYNSDEYHRDYNKKSGYGIKEFLENAMCNNLDVSNKYIKHLENLIKEFIVKH